MFVSRRLNALFVVIFAIAMGGLTSCQTTSGRKAATPRQRDDSPQDVNKFVHAAQVGDLATVKQLLEKGVDVNAAGSSSSTALMVASQQGQRQVVETLLNNGAD